MTAPLTPPDLERCQAEKVTRVHFALGGTHHVVRCNAAPVVVATESEPGKDGQTGSMSLCGDCQAHMVQQLGAGFASFERIGATV